MPMIMPRCASAAKTAQWSWELERKNGNSEKVEGEFSAHGARAVFYRQLLEYKKEKYFIFSKMTLTSLFLAAIMSFVMRSAAQKTGHPELFLLGVLAYVTLCMTGYLGKWETELKNPYLFLIPDSPFKKIWYATLMEHVKALADGIVVCVPMVVSRSVWSSIVIYTVLQANKLYLKVIAQWMVGELLREGRTGTDPRSDADGDPWSGSRNRGACRTFDRSGSGLSDSSYI